MPTSIGPIQLLTPKMTENLFRRNTGKPLLCICTQNNILIFHNLNNFFPFIIHSE